MKLIKPITKQTYALFWRHARNYKWALFLMVGASIGTTVFHLLVPLYYKRFLDTLAASGLEASNELIANLTGIIISILVFQTITWIFYRIAFFINVHFETRVIADLANSSFAYLHKHSYHFFINRFVGALVRKMNRLLDAFEGITDRLYYDLLPLVLRVAGILIVLFYRHVILGVIVLIWIFLYLVINYLFAVYKLKYDEKEAEIDTEATARIADTITNNATIKIFNGFPFEFNEFTSITGRQRIIKKSHGILAVI